MRLIYFYFFVRIFEGFDQIKVRSSVETLSEAPAVIVTPIFVNLLISGSSVFFFLELPSFLFLFHFLQNKESRKFTGDSLKPTRSLENQERWFLRQNLGLCFDLTWFFHICLEEHV